MERTTGTIEILDPTAEDVPEELGLSEVLPDLRGKVVGILENRKYHADTFLAELQEVLLKDYGVAKVVCMLLPSKLLPSSIWYRYPSSFANTIVLFNSFIFSLFF